jgi:hypothetical protein
MKLPFFIALCLSFAGCYSFKGISIDPDVSTFSVQTFEIQTANAPPTVGLDFTERLKDKVRSETRLVLRTEGTDVEFTGRVTDFRVVPVAPRPGETVSLNRLELGLSVRYINTKNEKKSWPAERSFRHFAEFDNTVDLLSVQDGLLRNTIFPQLLEDVFNAAFNDW